MTPRFGTGAAPPDAAPVGVDPALSGPAGEAAIALTGWISGPPPPPPSLDESAAEALVRRCEDHRLLGALGEAVRLGGWALPDGAHARLSSNLPRWATCRFVSARCVT